MIVSEIKLYELLKAKIGDKEAEAFIQLLESRVDQKIEDRKHEFLLEKDKDKLLTKADAIAIFASKEDVANSKAEMIKWMFIFWIGQIAAMVAIVKLLG